jgi:PTS system ascorbate-specific IIA component
VSVGVLLVTHLGLGPDLLRAARRVMPVMPLRAEALEIPWDVPDTNAQQVAVRTLAQRLDDGDGLLVLVDLYGSTPANVARTLDPGRQVRRVYGVNLPMLLRVLNYPQQNLDALAQVAREGGRAGVISDDG